MFFALEAPWEAGAQNGKRPEVVTNLPPWVADLPPRSRLSSEACGAPLVHRAALSRVIFFSLSGARDGQPQVAEFQAQGLPGDPQQASRLLQIPSRVLQYAGQQEPVDLAVRFRIEIAGIGLDPLVEDECLHPRSQGTGVRSQGTGVRSQGSGFF